MDFFYRMQIGRITAPSFEIYGRQEMLWDSVFPETHAKSWDSNCIVFSTQSRTRPHRIGTFHSGLFDTVLPDPAGTDFGCIMPYFPDQNPLIKLLH